MIKNSYYKGKIYEFLSCMVLFFRGYKIVKNRYKTRFGEIDIVAKKSNVIVFIEVKYRQNEIDAMEVVQMSQTRICNAARVYIAQNKNSNLNYRFDAIIWHSIIYFNHIKNIW